MKPRYRIYFKGDEVIIRELVWTKLPLGYQWLAKISALDFYRMFL